MFKFEDGLSQVKTFIDTEILNSHSSNLIPHNNKSAQDDVMGNDSILDNESLQIIEAIYDVDFKNFQYSRTDASLEEF